MAKAEGQYCPLPKDHYPRSVFSYLSSYAVAIWGLDRVPTLRADRTTRMRWQRESIERRSR